MNGLAIAISSYNRRDLAAEAVQSAFAFGAALRELPFRGVVVADDASADGTAALLRQRFADRVADGSLMILERAQNGGAAAAKNDAVAGANAEWVLILDSDDRLIAEAAPALEQALRASAGHPVVFFRCIDLDSGELVGPPRDGAYELDLRAYLHDGPPGETLPVVRRDRFLAFPFEPRWRGREGWAWARMIEAFGPALVHPAIVRRYRQAATHRVSTRAGSRRHAQHLLQFHVAMLRRYGRVMGPAAVARRLARIGYYGAVRAWQKLLRRPTDPVGVTAPPPAPVPPELTSDTAP
jgi:glycosyltransferase involved in cell wall biosynthesis